MCDAYSRSDVRSIINGVYDPEVCRYCNMTYTCEDCYNCKASGSNTIEEELVALTDSLDMTRTSDCRDLHEDFVSAGIDTPPFEWREFTYGQFGNGKFQGIQRIACYDQDDFHALLVWWNRAYTSGWFYFPVAV